MHGCVIELVNISSAINLNSSWRSIANEICRKINGFSYWFASGISNNSTKHIWRVFQSLRGPNWRLLMPFPCICCMSSSFNRYVGTCILGYRRSNSSADLHETFRYPPNHQDLQGNRETFRHCPVSYQTWAKMMYSNNDWTAIVPIFPHRGNFDLPERYILPSKRYNTT